MDVVIFGASATGTYLANALSAEGHNVTLIDSDPDALYKFSQNTDTATIYNTATNWKVLEAAKQEGSPSFIAVSDCDADNLVACAIAKRLEYSLTIATVREISFVDRSKIDCSILFGADHIIAPEVVVAHEIFKAISNPGSLSIENFFHGKLQSQIHTIPNEWKYIDTKIKDIDFTNRFKIALIKRKSKHEEDIYTDSELLYPDENTKIGAGDEVTFIGKADDMRGLPGILGNKEKKLSSVFISGGSRYAAHLSHILHDRNVEVKIVEEDCKNCEKLAEELEFATILNHDITDLDYLIEESAKEYDTFVACTNSTERNLLVATLAQEAECQNVVTFVSSKRYHHLLKRLGISFALSEIISLSNLILSYIYGEMITTVSSIYHNQMKILECLVGEKSPANNLSIGDLGKKLPKESVLSFMESDGEAMFGDLERKLKPGDRIIIITASSSTQSVNALF
ncbi:MAG: Trk system potassium uptake protein TrkA [Chlamydiia bacterium]|nr:Trk system potassium uptake protein TrkA [Chlamydiia bacterium]